MVIRFNNPYLQRLFENKPLLGKPHFPNDVIQKYKKTVLMLQYAGNIRELRKFKGLNFEALKGERKGSHSVRVDRKYRLIIKVEEEKIVEITEVLIIEDLTNHYD
jgi:proteic killer suppression protein